MDIDLATPDQQNHNDQDTINSGDDNSDEEDDEEIVMIKQKQCRICGEHGELGILLLMEQHQKVRDWITKYLAVTINNTNGYTNKVCFPCVQKIQDWIRFHAHCQIMQRVHFPLPAVDAEAKPEVSREEDKTSPKNIPGPSRIRDTSGDDTGKTGSSRSRDPSIEGPSKPGLSWRSDTSTEDTSKPGSTRSRDMSAEDTSKPGSTRSRDTSNEDPNKPRTYGSRSLLTGRICKPNSRPPLTECTSVPGIFQNKSPHTEVISKPRPSRSRPSSRNDSTKSRSRSSSSEYKPTTIHEDKTHPSKSGKNLKLSESREKRLDESSKDKRELHCKKAEVSSSREEKRRSLSRTPARNSARSRRISLSEDESESENTTVQRSKSEQIVKTQVKAILSSSDSNSDEDPVVHPLRSRTPVIPLPPGSSDVHTNSSSPLQSSVNLDSVKASKNTSLSLTAKTKQTETQKRSISPSTDVTPSKKHVFSEVEEISPCMLPTSTTSEHSLMAQITPQMPSSTKQITPKSSSLAQKAKALPSSTTNGQSLLKNILICPKTLSETSSTEAKPRPSQTKSRKEIQTKSRKEIQAKHQTKRKRKKWSTNVPSDESESSDPSDSEFHVDTTGMRSSEINGQVDTMYSLRKRKPSRVPQSSTPSPEPDSLEKAEIPSSPTEAQSVLQDSEIEEEGFVNEETIGVRPLETIYLVSSPSKYQSLVPECLEEERDVFSSTENTDSSIPIITSITSLAPAPQQEAHPPPPSHSSSAAAASTSASPAPPPPKPRLTVNLAKLMAPSARDTLGEEQEREIEDSVASIAAQLRQSHESEEKDIPLLQDNSILSTITPSIRAATQPNINNNQQTQPIAILTPSQPRPRIIQNAQGQSFLVHSTSQPTPAMQLRPRIIQTTQGQSFLIQSTTQSTPAMQTILTQPNIIQGAHVWVPPAQQNAAAAPIGAVRFTVVTQETASAVTSSLVYSTPRLHSTPRSTVPTNLQYPPIVPQTQVSQMPVRSFVVTTNQFQQPLVTQVPTPQQIQNVHGLVNPNVTQSVPLTLHIPQTAGEPIVIGAHGTSKNKEQAQQPTISQTVTIRKKKQFTSPEKIVKTVTRSIAPKPQNEPTPSIWNGPFVNRFKALSPSQQEVLRNIFIKLDTLAASSDNSVAQSDSLIGNPSFEEAVVITKHPKFSLLKLNDRTKVLHIIMQGLQKKCDPKTSTETPTTSTVDVINLENDKCTMSEQDLQKKCDPKTSTETPTTSTVDVINLENDKCTMSEQDLQKICDPKTSAETPTTSTVDVINLENDECTMSGQDLQKKCDPKTSAETPTTSTVDVINIETDECAMSTLLAKEVTEPPSLLPASVGNVSKNQHQFVQPNAPVPKPNKSVEVDFTSLPSKALADLGLTIEPPSPAPPTPAPMSPPDSPNSPSHHIGTEFISSLYPSVSDAFKSSVRQVFANPQASVSPMSDRNVSSNVESEQDSLLLIENVCKNTEAVVTATQIIGQQQQQTSSVPRSETGQCAASQMEPRSETGQCAASQMRLSTSQVDHQKQPPYQVEEERQSTDRMEHTIQVTNQNQQQRLSTSQMEQEVQSRDQNQQRRQPVSQFDQERQLSSQNQQQRSTSQMEQEVQSTDQNQQRRHPVSQVDQKKQLSSPNQLQRLSISQMEQEIQPTDHNQQRRQPVSEMAKERQPESQNQERRLALCQIESNTQAMQPAEHQSNSEQLTNNMEFHANRVRHAMQIHLQGKNSDQMTQMRCTPTHQPDYAKPTPHTQMPHLRQLLQTSQPGQVPQVSYPAAAFSFEYHNTLRASLPKQSQIGYPQLSHPGQLPQPGYPQMSPPRQMLTSGYPQNTVAQGTMLSMRQSHASPHRTMPQSGYPQSAITQGAAQSMRQPQGSPQGTVHQSGYPQSAIPQETMQSMRQPQGSPQGIVPQSSYPQSAITQGAMQSIRPHQRSPQGTMPQSDYPQRVITQGTVQSMLQSQGSPQGTVPQYGYPQSAITHGAMESMRSPQRSPQGSVPQSDFHQNVVAQRTVQLMRQPQRSLHGIVPEYSYPQNSVAQGTIQSVRQPQGSPQGTVSQCIYAQSAITQGNVQSMRQHQGLPQGQASSYYQNQSQTRSSVYSHTAQTGHLQYPSQSLCPTNATASTVYAPQQPSAHQSQRSQMQMMQQSYSAVSPPTNLQAQYTENQVQNVSRQAIDDPSQYDRCVGRQPPPYNAYSALARHSGAAGYHSDPPVSDARSSAETVTAAQTQPQSAGTTWSQANSPLYSTLYQSCVQNQPTITHHATNAEHRPSIPPNYFGISLRQQKRQLRRQELQARLQRVQTITTTQKITTEVRVNTEEENSISHSQIESHLPYNCNPVPSTSSNIVTQNIPLQPNLSNISAPNNNHDYPLQSNSNNVIAHNELHISPVPSTSTSIGVQNIPIEANNIGPESTFQNNPPPSTQSVQNASLQASSVNAHNPLPSNASIRNSLQNINPVHTNPSNTQYEPVGTSSNNIDSDVTTTQLPTESQTKLGSSSISNQLKRSVTKNMTHVLSSSVSGQTSTGSIQAANSEVISQILAISGHNNELVSNENEISTEPTIKTYIGTEQQKTDAVKKRRMSDKENPHTLKKKSFIENNLSPLSNKEVGNSAVKTIDSRRKSLPTDINNRLETTSKSLKTTPKEIDCRRNTWPNGINSSKNRLIFTSRRPSTESKLPDMPILIDLEGHDFVAEVSDKSTKESIGNISGDEDNDFTMFETATTTIDCIKCNKNFTDYQALLAHHEENHKYSQPEEESPEITGSQILETIRTENKEEKNYPCHQCTKTFQSQQNLETHIAKHLKVNLFQCVKCPKQYRSRRSLNNHCKTTHNGIHSYPCKNCDKSCKSKEEREKHYREAHSIFNYVCKICKISFSSYVSLSQHKNLVHGENTRCHICDKIFSLRSSLKKHFKQVHGITLPENSNIHHHPVKETENMPVDSKHAENNNVQIVTKQLSKQAKNTPFAILKPNKPTINCKYCIEKFIDNEKLMEHCKKSHKHLKFCSECRYVAKSEHVLNNHMRKHEHDRLLKEFNQILNERHLESDFPCVYCDENFSSYLERKEHAEETHKALPYACDDCPMRLQSVEIYNLHVMGHEPNNN